MKKLSVLPAEYLLKHFILSERMETVHLLRVVMFVKRVAVSQELNVIAGSFLPEPPKNLEAVVFHETRI